MKKIAVFFIAYNLFLCACSVPQINKDSIINNTPVDISLVPFFEEKEENNLYTNGCGYANSETLEIIIKSQYHRAANFVGDFAVVQKKESGKYSIINKNNTELMKNFDYAFLYQLDNGTVLAFTLSYHERRITYRLYNLNNGILLKVDYYRRPNINIIIIDNYIIYYNSFNEYLDIYEISVKGKLKKVNITVEDFFAKIIQKNNLQYRENNFDSFASDKGYTYRYKIILYRSEKQDYSIKRVDIKFYFHSLDINEIIKIVPYNMKLKTYDRKIFSDSAGADIKYDIDLINWDKTYPFKKKNYLYRIALVSYESGKEKEYNGLYDPSNNSWVIPPLEGRGRFYIIDDNWVAYELPPYHAKIYNTKTKEIRDASYIYGNRMYPQPGFQLYFHD
jgi:hypothetical protein